MGESIRVLIADDNQQVSRYIQQWLAEDGDIEVVGIAAEGAMAVAQIEELQPSIAIVEASLRVEGGVQVATIVARSFPGTRLILTSPFQPDQASRDAMSTAGVGFLRKPFMGEEAVTAVRRMYEYMQRMPQPALHVVPPPDPDVAPAATPARQHVPGEGSVFTVFSGKGGVGKSLVASNLAVSLSLATGARVALIDLSLQFGDIAAFLNLPLRMTISDLAAANAMADRESVLAAFADGPEGIKVLLAPLRPEFADYVTPEHFRALMAEVKTAFDFIVIDAPSQFSDLTTDAVEMAESIVLLTDFSIASIKSTRLTLEVLNALDIVKERRVIVANNASVRGLSDQRTAEGHLKEPIRVVLPYDPDIVNASIARATPFVIGKPSAQISQRIGDLVSELVPTLRERAINLKGRTQEKKRSSREGDRAGEKGGGTRGSSEDARAAAV